MPFHFCTDELLALMAVFPVIGVIFHKIHLWWHGKSKHPCHHVTEQCNEEHAEHTESDTHGTHGH